MDRLPETKINDGSENFYRGWTEYENGFGNVKEEYWLGLKKISCLTKVSVKTKLRQYEWSEFFFYWLASYP